MHYETWPQFPHLCKGRRAQPCRPGELAECKTLFLPGKVRGEGMTGAASATPLRPVGVTPSSFAEAHETPRGAGQDLSLRLAGLQRGRAGAGLCIVRCWVLPALGWSIPPLLQKFGAAGLFPLLKGQASPLGQSQWGASCQSPSPRLRGGLRGNPASRAGCCRKKISFHRSFLPC